MNPHDQSERSDPTDARTLRVVERLYRGAEDRPGAPAVIDIDTAGQPRHTLSYGALRTRTEALAARIRTELPPSPVIMVCFPNRSEVVTAFFGVIAAGATVFPVHPQLAESELLTAAQRSRAAAIIGMPRAAAALSREGLRVIECPASGDRRTGSADLNWSAGARLLLQSSGTTGPPKIVDRRGPALDVVARNVADSVGLRASDHVLGVTPACHSYGVENLLVGPIWAGSAVVLCPSLDAVISPGAPEHPVTVFPGVPAMFEYLAARSSGGIPPALRALRRPYSAGAPLPRTVFDAIESRLGVRVGQLYGMTEIGSVTFNDPDESDHNPESAGAPMAGVRIRIVKPGGGTVDTALPPGAEGEVAVSAPSMLTGYLHNDTGTTEQPPNLRNGFFFTGDLGRLDDRGRLTITGRIKLIVDVGGMKVNLLEVEDALIDHPGVRECAVAPVALSETVSRLRAVIVPARLDDPPSGESLRRFLRQRLSPYKIPRTFEMRTDLPRSATGKVLRHRL